MGRGFYGDINEINVCFLVLLKDIFFVERIDFKKGCIVVIRILIKPMY